MGSPESAGNARLSAGGGYIAAWAGLAVVDAAMIARLRLPEEGLAVRALHHVYDAGQLLALGLLTAAIVEAWERWGPRRALWGYIACAAVAFAVAFPVVGEELAGPARRLAGEGSSDASHVLLLALVALAVPVAAAVGHLLARPRVRAAGVLLGLAAAIGNHGVLTGDYFGAHFFIAWGAAALAGASLRGAELPWREPSSRALTALRAFAALAAAVTVVVRPSNAVLIHLFDVDGAILAPLLERARAAAAPDPKGHEIPPASREWFTDRSTVPDIAPDAPALLPPDGIILFITIDAVRADVFEDKRHAATIPTMASLYRRSVRFTQARSTAPQTNVSLTTTFAGRYYSQQLWTARPDMGRGTVWPHEEPAVRFTERLSAAGVPTVTFASADYLTNAFGTVRGFTEERFVRNTPHAAELGDLAVARINAHTDGPLFLFMHFLDPHYPYNRAGTEGPPFDRYVGEIGIVDKEIQRIWQALGKRGFHPRTALILSADHGEAFGEHGRTRHATTVYDEMLRVPLFMVLPGIRPRAVAQPVSLIDIGPTVLSMMGLPTPGAMMGQSLTPFLRGENPALTRPLVADSGRLMQAMVFPDGVKMIRDKRRGTVEMFDLRRDPGEAHNAFNEHDAASLARLDTLRAFFDVHTRTSNGYSPPYRR